MSYTTPNNRAEFADNAQMEYRAQGIMDNWYMKNGFEIVSREGTRERDLILSMNGNHLKIEEKYRRKDYGDFLIELIQDIPSNSPGWFYTENPDRLVYIIVDNEEKPVSIYWVKFRDFKTWICEYLETYKIQKAVISPAGWGLTMNLAIPWRCIDKELYKKFTDIYSDDH